jgi:hypothetical protein
MTSKGYELKRGVFLQPFGHPELAGSNNELTDEKAEKILKVQPGLVIYFSKIPETITPVTAPTIIKPPEEKLIEVKTPEVKTSEEKPKTENKSKVKKTNARK